MAAHSNWAKVVLLGLFLSLGETGTPFAASGQCGKLFRGLYKSLQGHKAFVTSYGKYPDYFVACGYSSHQISKAAAVAEAIRLCKIHLPKIEPASQCQTFQAK